MHVKKLDSFVSFYFYFILFFVIFFDVEYDQAWITLGRAQLNFGEPDSAIESFDKALAIKVTSILACSFFCVYTNVDTLLEPTE